MLNRFASIGLPLLMLALMVGCGGNNDRTDIPGGEAFQGARAVPVVEQVHGNDSALDEPTIRLIQDRNALDELGVEELSNLEVNFSEYDVIVFALGEQPSGGYWAHISGVQQVGEVLYVQGTANQPGEDQAATQALTYPFAAVVIPKTDAATTLSDIDSVRGESRPE
ncbi:protease complex subunit PrcB family protein [Phycisphaerales bacterium AB-hyl4]|uniref:Protease complex subunit PrcB family protein n=1 Tax=Natronomicrosphaera hydrolytica TaxID=3242702 RepID=A0ABV4U0Y8_9BACT